jgi:hypothetical protein
MSGSAELALVTALARAGDPSAIPALRELVAHADAELRMLVQIGLARARDDDPATVEPRLLAESSPGIYCVLAARAGRLAIGPGALGYLAAQAVYARTPAVLAANCAWAVAQHDAARGPELVGALAPDARRFAEALLRGRGAQNDRVAALLGW